MEDMEEMIRDRMRRLIRIPEGKNREKKEIIFQD